MSKNRSLAKFWHMYTLGYHVAFLKKMLQKCIYLYQTGISKRQHSGQIHPETCFSPPELRIVFLHFKGLEKKKINTHERERVCSWHLLSEPLQKMFADL